ncbi:hypothetical protein GCM10025862_29450 [Arsenicicoccus piscis]|uniref:Cobalt transporter n=1 Tax=Arsenicicoccus piscis TaxID=673954 RepID=A0ABQ6HT87_9MICO|nr:hypothetical protein GCM10025862_29450 [Arsenicicoccus piscis]
MSGALSGALGFVFAYLLVEPIINRAIDYESGRADMLAAIRQVLHLPVEDEGPEIFSRSLQSTVGAATGIIGMGVALGLLTAVAWLLLGPRTNLRPRTLAWIVAGLGFLGIFLLPFSKYPANPPAIGHDFSIADRGHVYLTMVAGSVAVLLLAVLTARSLSPRLGRDRAVWAAIAVFVLAYGALFAALPSLGDLAVNVTASHDIGFTRSATETPAPIINTTGQALTVDGMHYAPGQIMYPGFAADDLWAFRWYSLLEQLIIWGGIAVGFGWLVERHLGAAEVRSGATSASRTLAQAPHR